MAQVKTMKSICALLLLIVSLCSCGSPAMGDGAYRGARPGAVFWINEDGGMGDYYIGDIYYDGKLQKYEDRVILKEILSGLRGFVDTDKRKYLALAARPIFEKGEPVQAVDFCFIIEVRDLMNPGIPEKLLAAHASLAIPSSGLSGDDIILEVVSGHEAVNGGSKDQK